MYSQSLNTEKQTSSTRRLLGGNSTRGPQHGEPAEAAHTDKQIHYILERLTDIESHKGTNFLLISLCEHTSHGAHLWRLEDNFWVLALNFHHVGLEN